MGLSRYPGAQGRGLKTSLTNKTTSTAMSRGQEKAEERAVPINSIALLQIIRVRLSDCAKGG
jgi:hypothetical protein